MNCITCGALLCLHVDAISRDKRIVFAACLALAALGKNLATVNTYLTIKLGDKISTAAAHRPIHNCSAPIQYTITTQNV
jgi:hypothetical protein